MIRRVLAALLLITPARAADVTVLTAGAFKPVAEALVPAFEATSGHHVILRNDTAGALVRRIQGGEVFDVVILSPAGLADVAGKVVPDSIVQVARARIGVAVKSGAPKPDIGSVAAFKAAMLAARSVAYIDPASGGSSGIYIAKLFERLGIAEAMAGKSVLVHGGLAAGAVADGRAELVVHQISEIMLVPGVDVVGPLPPEIQNETVYAAGLASGSAMPDVAAGFIKGLSGAKVTSVLMAKGMAPP